MAHNTFVSIQAVGRNIKVILPKSRTRFQLCSPMSEKYYFLYKSYLVKVFVMKLTHFTVSKTILVDSCANFRLRGGCLPYDLMSTMISADSFSLLLNICAGYLGAYIDHQYCRTMQIANWSWGHSKSGKHNWNNECSKDLKCWNGIWDWHLIMISSCIGLDCFSSFHCFKTALEHCWNWTLVSRIHQCNFSHTLAIRTSMR